MRAAEAGGASFGKVTIIADVHMQKKEFGNGRYTTVHGQR